MSGAPAPSRFPAPETVGLPAYAWDARMRRGRGAYVNLASGRVVSASELSNALRAHVRAVQERMAALGEAAANGNLSPAEFQIALSLLTRQANAAATAMARGGWAQMSKSDWGRVGSALRMEYKRLAAFADALAAGDLSPAQARARASLYADSAFGRYWNLETSLQREAGATAMRRVPVGDDRVCEECLADAALGWRPLGQVPIMLHAGDRCDFDYQFPAESSALLVAG